MTAFLGWLAELTLGPRCLICSERRRGWRTMLVHLEVDHAGDLP